MQQHDDMICIKIDEKNNYVSVMQSVLIVQNIVMQLGLLSVDKDSENTYKKYT